MKIDRNENLIKRYLLGELAEAEQTAFEQVLMNDRIHGGERDQTEIGQAAFARELLNDQSKFDQVWAIENELIGNYVRGEMSRADRERFESHYMASPLHRERVAIAELFLTSIDQTTDARGEVRETPWWSMFLPRRPQIIFAGASVTALLLLLGAVWGLIERTRLTEQIAKIQNETQIESSFLKKREQELALRNKELEKEVVAGRQRSEQMQEELEQLRRQPQPALSFLFNAESVRNGNAPPPPTVPLIKGNARFLMELDGDEYQSYQVRLQTAEGQEILRKQADKISFGKGRAFAAVTIPTRTLAKGDYVLILSGQTTDGRIEEIDRYFFQAL